MDPTVNTRRVFCYHRCMDEERVGKIVRRELNNFYEEALGPYLDKEFDDLKGRVTKVEKRLDKVDVELKNVSSEVSENTKALERLTDVTLNTRTNHEMRMRELERVAGLKPDVRLKF